MALALFVLDPNYLNWIVKQLPEEKYLVSYYDICELAIKTNGKTSLTHFLHYITIPFKDHIFRKDEKFFLDQKIEDTGIGKDKDSLMKALKMKNLWMNKFDETQKETVWKYLKALVMLSEHALVEYKEKQ